MIASDEEAEKFVARLRDRFSNSRDGTGQLSRPWALSEKRSAEGVTLRRLPEMSTNPSTIKTKSNCPQGRNLTFPTNAQVIFS